MSDKPPSTLDPEKEGFFESYASYSTTLRTWLIAYGVGVPALLLTHDPLVQRVLASGRAPDIAKSFLAGVGFQVVGAFLYKSAMWYLFIGHDRPRVRKAWQYKAADWLSEAFWLDWALDLASILLFAVGTYTFFKVLLP
jgi:hypothetical protein